MAKTQYLIINGMSLPMPDAYDVDYSAVEADSSGLTEAGTSQRDVVRIGIASVTASFLVSKRWLGVLGNFAKQDKLEVQYFDPGAVNLADAQMYIDGFKAKRERDTKDKGLWTVSFTLQEM